MSVTKLKSGIALTCLKCGRLMRPDFTHKRGPYFKDTFDIIYEAFRCPECNRKVTTRRFIE